MHAIIPNPPILRLLTGLTLGFLSACKTAPDPLVEAKPASLVLFEWKGAELTGPLAMRIDLSEQKAQLMRGGESAGWTYVASGISGHRTPTGSFNITEKVRDKFSSSWGKVVDSAGTTVDSDARNGREPVPSGGRFVGAPMPFWMRIHGPIGMHAGLIPYPGSPASHGCIRLPREMAEILFDVSVIGTPVKVVP